MSTYVSAVTVSFVMVSLVSHLITITWRGGLGSKQLSFGLGFLTMFLITPSTSKLTQSSFSLQCSILLAVRQRYHFL